MRLLALPMAGHPLGVLGPRRFLRSARNVLPLSRIKEAEDEECFINTLAVLPRFQCQGVGTNLLGFVEDRARGMGLRACSLSVEIGNTDALRLHQRRGYRLLETCTVRQLHAATGSMGFHRMVKGS